MVFSIKVLQIFCQNYLCCCAVTQSCLTATPWTTALQAFLSFTISWSLHKLMSIELTMPSNHLVLCRPLLLPLIFPSIRVFSNELALHTKWPKYWSFSFSTSLPSEYSGLISFRMDWFDLLAVQETLKSLLQQSSKKKTSKKSSQQSSPFDGSKASILQHSALFMVQHSHPYMTTGKIISLTR